MKLVTYNLWNTHIHRLERLNAACEELSHVAADIVALQEVAARVDAADERTAARYIGDRCGYEHIVTRLYPDDPDEGLSILSKRPFSADEVGWDTSFGPLKNCGLRVCLTIDQTNVAITNVHLDYDSIAHREAQIVAVLEWIESRAGAECYEILCGDFNAPPDSSVYRFLMGQQTLLGKGVQPWHDVARYHAEKAGRTPAPTLDFWNNPRWRDVATLSIPARVDWIFLQDLFNSGLPYPHVMNADVFGTEPTPLARLVPSDHYGVYAELAFDT
ncbi:MAG: endonuclease/exonuclease/phosphatase family protein [Herpetosiphonaceae bacterium]|nr:endonuclease/exonuclease/phosphatase family protein [Herpetosiphonaceae bacterium]